MLLPTKLRIGAFMRIRDVEIDIRPGVYWVTGQVVDGSGEFSNGAGKSTLLHALRFALDGLPPGGRGKDAMSLERLGELTKVPVHTEITLSDGSTEYRLERTRSSSSQVKYWVDGKPSNARRGSPSSTHELAGEQMGIPWESLGYLHFLFSGSKKTGFLFDDDAFRKKMINTLFGHKHVARIIKNFEELDAPDLRKRFALEQGLEARYAGALEEAKERLDSVLREIDQAELHNRAIAEKAALAASEEMQKAAVMLEQVKAELATIEAEYEERRHAAFLTRDAVTKLRFEAETKKNEALAAKQDRRRIEIQFQEMAKTIKREEKCYACGQDLLTPEARKKIVAKIDEMKEALQEATRRLELAETPDPEQEYRERRAGASAVEADQKLARVTQRRQELGASLYALQKAQEKVLQPGTLIDVQALHRVRTELVARIQTLHGDRLAAEWKAEELAGELGLAEYWLGAWRYEIRSWAFDSIAAELTKMCNEELEAMKWTMSRGRFEAVAPEGNTKDQISMLVEYKDTPGEWMKGTDGSDGQVDVIAFATWLALRGRARPHLGLLCMDEPFKSLDRRLADRLLPRIYEEARENVVFLVTHNQDLVPRDGRQIRMVHENGVISVA